MTAINWARVAELAREIKPLHDAAEAAFERVLNENNTATNYEDYLSSVEAYNAKLTAVAPELADLTNNSTSNMLMLLVPAGPQEVKVTPQDFLNFANYESFNWRLWHKTSGYYREPTNSFTF